MSPKTRANIKNEAKKNMIVAEFPELSNWVEKFDIQNFNTASYAVDDPENKLAGMHSLNRQEELAFCGDLVADMFTSGACDEDLRKVIMYSMVIIDAEKLNLDWEKARDDFEIIEMIKKYESQHTLEWYNEELHPWQKRIMEHDQKVRDYEEKQLMVQTLSMHGWSVSEIAKKMNLPESTVRFFKEPKDDPVNHPSHYTDGKIEVIDFIEDKKLGFCLGNAVKYISRAGKKNPDKEIEDLEKAVWYVQRRIYELKNSEVVGYKIS